MIPIKQQLLGRTIESFTINERNHCGITISGGFTLCTESLVRYLGADGYFLTVEDHQQQFGLPSPIDAQKEIESRIKKKEIIDVSIDMGTGDLRISLTDGFIEAIATSSGYEHFQLEGPNSLMIGMGGKQTTEQGACHNADKSAS